MVDADTRQPWTREQLLQVVLGAGLLLFVASWAAPWAHAQDSVSGGGTFGGGLLFPGQTWQFNFDVSFTAWFWGGELAINGDEAFAGWLKWATESEGETSVFAWLTAANVLVVLGMVACLAAFVGPERLGDHPAAQSGPYFLAGGALTFLGILMFASTILANREDLPLGPAFWIAGFAGLMILAATLLRVDWSRLQSPIDAPPEHEA